MTRPLLGGRRGGRGSRGGEVNGRGSRRPPSPLFRSQSSPDPLSLTGPHSSPNPSDVVHGRPTWFTACLPVRVPRRSSHVGHTSHSPAGRACVPEWYSCADRRVLGAGPGTRSCSPRGPTPPLCSTPPLRQGHRLGEIPIQGGGSGGTPLTVSFLEPFSGLDRQSTEKRRVVEVYRTGGPEGCRGRRGPDT